MNHFLSVVFVLFLVVACNQNNRTATSKDSLANDNIASLLPSTNFDLQKLKGMYTGPFNGSPITVAINYISGSNVSGYNVHRGLKRNIKGSLQAIGASIKLLLDEPGNNPYDGHFEILIDTATYNAVGSWQPKNDGGLKKKEFKLFKKKDEQYNELTNTYTDSTNRNLQLNIDGSAVFSYYEKVGTPQEQLQNFNGNWQLQKDSVIVYWQLNPFFASRRSAFKILYQKYEGDSIVYIRGLYGEKREWTQFEP